MKRKLLLSLIIFGVFILVGCGNTKDETNKKLEEIVVTVNGIDLHLNQEKEFKGIKYTITDDLKEVVHEQYVQYYLYQESGPNLLFCRIFYYQDKTHNAIKKDLAIDDKLTEEKGKTDNIEYTLIDTKRTDGTIHFYIIDKDNVSYVINFVSQYDIKEFENKVLSFIKF